MRKVWTWLWFFNLWFLSETQLLGMKFHEHVLSPLMYALDLLDKGCVYDLKILNDICVMKTLLKLYFFNINLLNNLSSFETLIFVITTWTHLESSHMYHLNLRWICKHNQHLVTLKVMVVQFIMKQTKLEVVFEFFVTDSVYEVIMLPLNSWV